MVDLPQADLLNPVENFIVSASFRKVDNRKILFSRKAENIEKNEDMVVLRHIDVFDFGVIAVTGLHISKTFVLFCSIYVYIQQICLR